MNDMILEQEPAMARTASAARKGADQPPVLVYEHVRKVYGDFVALADVSLQVNKGEVMCLIGPSGSGKSTLLRCTNALEKLDGGRVLLDGVALPESESEVRRVRQRMGMVFQSFELFPHKSALDNVAMGPITVLGMAQDLTVGVSMSRLTSKDRIEYASNYLPLDVFHPNPHVPKPDSFPDSQRTSRYEPHVQKGIYAQLRSSLTEDLTLVSGGRFSWFESRYTTQAATWDDVSTAKASAEFTPMVGLVYALTPQWSAYASYADIFEPQTATTLDGSILKPIVGANYEVGVKGELMDGKLNTSFALYRIDQKNRAVQDYEAGPVCNGGYCSRAAGKQQVPERPGPRRPDLQRGNAAAPVASVERIPLARPVEPPERGGGRKLAERADQQYLEGAPAVVQRVERAGRV
ncbi:hypothetical protein G6F31_013921 [Rhizopus arrhizus]|nr:hypothetical protein G6F31_013921 [Rhizopus arrhizus]